MGRPSYYEYLSMYIRLHMWLAKFTILRIDARNDFSQSHESIKFPQTSSVSISHSSDHSQWEHTTLITYSSRPICLTQWYYRSSLIACDMDVEHHFECIPIWSSQDGRFPTEHPVPSTSIFMMNVTNKTQFGVSLIQKSDITCIHTNVCPYRGSTASMVELKTADRCLCPFYSISHPQPHSSEERRRKVKFSMWEPWMNCGPDLVSCADKIWLRFRHESWICTRHQQDHPRDVVYVLKAYKAI